MIVDCRLPVYLRVVAAEVLTAETHHFSEITSTLHPCGFLVCILSLIPCISVCCSVVQYGFSIIVAI